MGGKAPETEKEQVNISPFNFFDVVDFGRRREEDYSSVLAWLLRTEEEHGLGNEVLLGITDKLGLQFNDDTYNADTEKNDGGRMLDIPIDTDNWHIVIENKVRRGALNDAKLRDEYIRAKADTGEGKKFAFIFLYPARMERDLEEHIKEVIANDDAYPLTWTDVAEVLNELSISFRGNPVTKIFLKQFSEHLARLDMIMDSNAFTNAMEKHSGEIGKYMELYDNENQVKDLINKYLRFVVEGVFSEEGIKNNDFTRPKYTREKVSEGWTPYERWVEFRLEKNPNVYFWVSLYIDKDNGNKWGQYAGGSLPNEMFKVLSQELERITKTNKAKFEKNKYAKYTTYEGKLPFDPVKWEECAAASNRLIRDFILNINDYVKKTRKK